MSLLEIYDEDVDDGRLVHKPLPYVRTYAFQEIPEQFAPLIPTEFLISERLQDLPHVPRSKTLFIIPGFGVSAEQIEVDHLLWNCSTRYSRIITHKAVNYRTSQPFILAQYHALLQKLCQEAEHTVNILGISLGGGTAVQFLSHLQKFDPALYSRCRKLLTLVSPVHESDLSERWQAVLKFCRRLAVLNRSGEQAGWLRKTILEALVSGVRPLVRRSALEAETDDEVRDVFAYAGETFDGSRDIPLASLDGVEIVSFGLREDSMAPNTRACKYAKNGGRHVEVDGRHTPRFYSEAKELYDRMILDELG